MSPCNCYWMCIKYPAEIFIEIRVCLSLSRSPGPSGSHYHSLSRIAIPDKTDKTLSNNLQLPPAIRQKHSSRAFCPFWWRVLPSDHPPSLWLGGACGTPEWLSPWIKDAKIWGNRGPVFRCLPLVSTGHRSHDDSFLSLFGAGHSGQLAMFCQGLWKLWQRIERKEKSTDIKSLRWRFRKFEYKLSITRRSILGSVLLTK